MKVKRMISAVLILLLCFSLSACAKTYESTEELIEKARDEIPVSDADTIEMQYAGMCRVDDKALVWFISGSEYQAHYYLPMEIDVKGEEKYTFVRTYKPIDGRTEDVACLHWNGGYAFVINNSNCASVRITEENETHEEIIEQDSYPYVFYYPSIPTEYVFLDSNGNELQ